MDACRRVGQPVIVRHIWNREDVSNGLAIECPACYDKAYDQPRGDCPVCFGIGLVSVELDPTGELYIDTKGQLVLGDPGTHIRAPHFGGFGEPYLTFVIQADTSVDVLRKDEQGILDQTYDVTAIAPWFPTLGDNDLCTNVVLGGDGVTIDTIGDRYQLKRVQQITVRGFGARPHYIAGGQIYLLQQSCSMNKIPNNNILYQVPAEI